MVHKYVSIYNVIEKVYRDYEHQEELDIWDCIEWAAEALEFIGAGQQYERRVAELTLVNHASLLPCNYHSNPVVSYNGNPMSMATGAFAPMKAKSPNNTSNTLNGYTVNDENFPTAGNVNTQQNFIGEQFYIQDNVIVTSILSGTILMDYKAIKTDKEGYPMIPDLVSYKEAVAKYIQYKLDHRDWRRKRLTRDIYAESKNDWQWYCGQARGQANLPDLAYAEAIKNQWVKLKPNQNSAQSFYNDLAIREMKKIK